MDPLGQADQVVRALTPCIDDFDISPLVPIHYNYNRPPERAREGREAQNQLCEGMLGSREENWGNERFHGKSPIHC